MCNSCQQLLDKVDRLQAKISKLRMSRRVLISMVEDLISEKAQEINHLQDEKIELEKTNQKYKMALAQKNEILIDMAKRLNNN